MHRVRVAQKNRVDASEASGRTPNSCREHIGESWQGNSIAVSNARTSGRTASGGATEPGVVRLAFRKPGRRQNASWFTAHSLPQSLESGSAKRADGYWRDRAAMCPTFNRDDQGSNPCASIGSPDLAVEDRTLNPGRLVRLQRGACALLVQRISTPRYERGDMGSSPVEDTGFVVQWEDRWPATSRSEFDSPRIHCHVVHRKNARPTTEL